jgi:hypothetical protein
LATTKKLNPVKTASTPSKKSKNGARIIDHLLARLPPEFDVILKRPLYLS